ncbi:hypothetical protein CVT25_013769 [Psilocybe cyanescens]|uniref:T6SS Phospholipase effector Tle1-like catalytic domain-containing protein n=1 Tax=Psilocybe cyanescens TaxID=93625 RepID=A0A409XUV8_PSICY|nr:hypothetical protein CVT25_013769 [Psilocybe cyanescens]
MDDTLTVKHTSSDDETMLMNSKNCPISCLCEPLANGQFGRNLVVSIDGTANQFGLKNTNIVELYSRLIRDETQLTYYNSGIGTYVADSKSWFSLNAWNQFISHEWDKAFATNFKSKVLDAYEWLSENYKRGDRIFLFGFSRGAYQVRVIAGMIEKNEPFFNDDVEGGLEESPEALCKHFKESLSNSEVKVHFVGSWDTVSSVGILRGECLPETTTGMTHVCCFRHALALDELRVKFLPEYANGGSGPLPKEDLPAHSSKEPFGVKMESFADTKPHGKQNKSANVRNKKGGDVKEVWFAGSHSDIGGGNVKNLKNNQFGPSLRWMTYEALIWGLKMTAFDQRWAPLAPKSSMNWKWNILENLPILRLSYTSPNAVTRRWVYLNISTCAR